MSFPHRWKWHKTLVATAAAAAVGVAWKGLATNRHKAHADATGLSNSSCCCVAN